MGHSMTPGFIMTEELGDQLRPNGLEMNDISNNLISVSNNLVAFQREGECDMMLTEEFKHQIDNN